MIQQPRAQTMERKHQRVKVILVIYGHDEKGDHNLKGIPSFADAKTNAVKKQK